MDYYKPTLQTKFNEKGNCLAAVIATLYDIGIDDVPNLLNNEKTWEHNLSKWFASEFNKYIMVVGLGDLTQMPLFMNSMIMTTIESNSIHPEVKRHAVISQGDYIIFDPMQGIVKILLTMEMKPNFLIVGDIRGL